MSKTPEQPKNDNLQPRPPVVVVLGHVDHGKSSLLEAIREDFKITAKESGGITQHVGAYEVIHAPHESQTDADKHADLRGKGQRESALSPRESALSGGKKITFLDTPGHEAFSAIRSRGAKVADIAVLVVAADEGVKPQTKEAIRHALRESVSLVVAVNKMDKPEASPQKVYNELAKEEVLVEQMGGKVPAAEVSAKTKQGIDALLDLLLLVAEMEDLRADTELPAEGVVIEAYMDAKRGSTATLLVQQGILRVGDIVGTSSAAGKVKILENFLGEAADNAYPSSPALVLGFEEVPQVGEIFRVFPDRETAERHKAIPKRKLQAQKGEGAGEKKEFRLVLKTDVQGSLEAVEKMLAEIPQEHIALHIIHRGVGDIQEGDVQLAGSANAVIMGFRVRVSPQAVRLAERDDVPLKIFDVIYELSEGVRQIMERRLEPEIVRKDLGKMKVLVVFLSEKNRQIVGGKMLEGEFKKGMQLEVLREEEQVGKGKIAGLQENKKTIEKARKGQEVGILYEGDGKIQEGDIVVAYTKEKKKQTL